MRRTLLLSILLAAGCATGPFARERNLPTPTPTTDQLISHLNENARLVQSLDCDVSVDAKQGIKSFGVDGMMAYQKPNSFRLMLQSVGGTEADVGSNDQELWFWFKRDNPPTLYRCSHEDFPRVRNLRMPVQPEWIAEALCLKEFGPPDQYHQRVAGPNMELTTQVTSPQGQPLQKTVIIPLAGPNRGRVSAFRLRTPQGQEIYSAEITEYQSVGGYTIPRRVKLKCPADNIEFVFRLDRPKVNTLTAGRTGELFTRPTGYQEVDLARGPAANPPTSVQKVRGALE